MDKDMPKRVKINWRHKGGKKPDNTIIVARPTRWGNPFKVGDIVHRGPPYSGRDEHVRDNAHAVRLYKQWLFTQGRSENLIPELKGKDLACYCKLNEPCHADVLLEMANKDK